MTRHLTRRPCGKSSGFSWSRFTTDGEFVTYRLFRRDHRNALHTQMLAFTKDDTRAYIAARLSLARNKLRDRVETIDITALLEEGQPA